MRKTISQILADSQSEFCLQCGEPINNNVLKNFNYCSEECERLSDGKNWPKSEDCPGCPGHINGHHKMSCSYNGKQQIRLNVKLKGN